jgi:isoleucyl-tRNA synthetase
VYEGFKVMPFSAKLGTPLSNFEANLNYKDVDDPSLTAIFPLVEEQDTSLLIWTTTPWTLPSNLAVLASPALDYVKVREKKSAHHYILAHSLLSRYFKDPAEYDIVSTFKGTALYGKRYQPLFPYFEEHAQKKAFRILLEESVSSEEGTGLVHAAPAFGEVDFFACSKEGIELICPVDRNGRFTKEVPDFQGLFVKDADKEILRKLKAEKKVFHFSQVRHRYPFCWRSDTPLIYKAVSSWFVAVEKCKEQILAANQKIYWVPEHIKEGRFGKWLENARDWAISRNRYWGTPIPIWRNAEGDIRVISSIQELEEKTGKSITDLHRHFIDDLTFEEEGKLYRRIPEVFDCWFESGSMPYAQEHYPFENKEETLKRFPADFIAEGIDQTRGWFYTLTVLAAALFDKPAFKNVIVNGIILAEDGAKMSKRLKNYPEPDAVFNRFGADAVRLYLLNSPAVRAEDLSFSERGVELILRQALIPFWNAFVFLSTYARIYNWTPQDRDFLRPSADIDRWILSLVQRLGKEVSEGMDAYDLNRAVEPFVAFIDQLTNWYIRRSRARFWAEEDTEDRRQAFETLYSVLIILSTIAAPFIPFLSEAIYLQLRRPTDLQSIHLCDFPQYRQEVCDIALEEEMAYVQQVVSVGHALRKEHKLKVRQPLPKAFVISSNERILSALNKQKHLICDELNVKDVHFETREEEFVTLKPKPNFRVLGKKVGKHMNALHKAIEGFSQAQLAVLLKGSSLEIHLEGEKLTLAPEDVGVERSAKEGHLAATTGEITVALDTHLSDELILEGFARELVNKINTMRRDAGFAVTDRIVIELELTDKVKAALEKHRAYIMHEVLATEIHLACENGTEWDINGESARIGVSLSIQT